MELEKNSLESAPKLKRVERRQIRNKKALLAAARKLIHEKGVDTTTMQQITEIADVGVGTMYNYFKSKDDLIRQIVKDEIVDLVESTLIGRESSFEPILQGGYNYWYFLQKLSQDALWKHLLTRPELFLETIYEALEPIPKEFFLASFYMQDVDGTLTETEFQLARWQSIGALTGVGMAVQSGRLEYNEALLKAAIRNVYRLHGLGEEKIEKVMADFPPPVRD